MHKRDGHELIGDTPKAGMPDLRVRWVDEVRARRKLEHAAAEHALLLCEHPGEACKLHGSGLHVLAVALQDQLVCGIDAPPQAFVVLPPLDAVAKVVLALDAVVVHQHRLVVHAQLPVRGPVRVAHRHGEDHVLAQADVGVLW